MRPEPGKGSEIFKLPLGSGCDRFLLKNMTIPTIDTAPVAEAMTMPTLAPVERFTSFSVESVEFPLAEADDVAAAAAPPDVAAPEPVVEET